jgi:hypothetical protein
LGTEFGAVVGAFHKSGDENSYTPRNKHEKNAARIDEAKAVQPKLRRPSNPFLTAQRARPRQHD